MIVMNKILTIIFAITAMMCVTSCSDDDNYYAGTDTIAIISNTASDMPSIASSAKVVVEGSGNISVTSSSEWCIPTVEGNVIDVSVMENPSLESRCAVLTVKAGNGERKVSVLQRGMAFALSAPEYNNVYLGSELVFPMEHSGTVIATSEVPWMSAKVEENVLRVKIEDNVSGSDREGTIIVTAGKYNREIKFYQYELSNVFGEYTLSGKNAGGTSYVSYNGTLSVGDNDASLVFVTVIKGVEYSIPFAFEATGEITFSAGVSCGMSGRNYLYTAVGSAEANNGRGAQFKTYGSMSGKLAKSGSGGMECILADNGSVAGHDIDLMRVNRYSVESITESTTGTNVLTVREPVLRKK